MPPVFKRHGKFDIYGLFVHFFFIFTSGAKLNILLVCGGGAAGSGRCDYQTVMNALLMRSEQLGSASASVGRMTATVRLTPPNPQLDRHHDLLRPPGCFFFSRPWRSSSSSFTRAGANAHPYDCCFNASA